MLNFREAPRATCIRFYVQICDVVFSTAAVIVIPLLILLFIITFALHSVDRIEIIYIDKWKSAPQRTSPRFLSIGLDSSVIADGFHNFNTTDEKLISMVRHLYPAYLRVGGNLADKLYFSPNLEEPDESTVEFYKNLQYDEYRDFGKVSSPNYTMTGKQWLDLIKFAGDTHLSMFFGLNALMRFPNGSWDYRNAKSLINFSSERNLNVNWELGNEPNSFNHKFKEAVNATQLARDFATLRKLLEKYPHYSWALLVGPDITRPQENHKESEVYLDAFLEGAVQSIDAITWHQYYLDSRTAVAKDFLNPKVFDLLQTEIESIQNITKPFDSWKKQIWLGETGSAYGGGAPNLSDTFIGSFMWVDKLGLSAKMGVNVLIRQSLFRGYYSLLDNNYDPNPDWWISVLYKKIIGTRVVPCYTACSPELRLYCHCTNEHLNVGSISSVTVFGVNVDSRAKKIRIEGLFSSPFADELYEHTFHTTVYAFEFTSESLFSKSVYLNGKLLEMASDNKLPDFQSKIVSSRPFITMPPFSVVFWVIPTSYVKACAK